MADNPPRFTFVSSDARPRYIDDIMRIIALPVGGQLHFRYQARYAAPDVQQWIAAKNVVGAQAVVCFVGDVGTDGVYAIPVRYVFIVGARRLDDAYIVRFAARGFPDISDWLRDSDNVKERGRVLLRGLMSNYRDEYYAAYARDPTAPSTDNADSQESWNGVVSRLARLPAFSGSYFLRASLERQSGREMALTKGQDWFDVISGREFVLRSWFVGEGTDFSGRNLEIICDEQLLYPTSDTRYDISSRYDEVKFWIAPRGDEVTRRTLLRLTLNAGTGSNGGLSTRVDLPIRIRAPRRRQAARVTLGGVSALAVAAPAILGDVAPVPYNLALAGAGALGLAYLSKGT